MHLNPKANPKSHKMPNPNSRRDKTWARPDRESAPAWPAQMVRIFAVGVTALALLAGLYAGWNFARSIFHMGSGPDVALKDEPSQSEPVPRSLLPEDPFGASQSHVGADGFRYDSEGYRLDSKGNRMIPTQPLRRNTPPATSPTPSVPATNAGSGSASEQARAFGKARQQTEVGRGREALKAVDAWGEEARLWRDNVEALLTNDAGRRIAGQTELVDQFRALLAEKRPPLELPIEMATAVRGMLEPLEKALADRDDVTAPPQGMAEEFQRYAEEAQSQAAILRQLRFTAEAIAEQANQSEPTDVTLAEALTQRERALAAAQARNLRERMSEAERESAEKVAAAREEAMRLEADRKTAEIQARAEFEKLAARAKSPDVKRYLGTFLAKGYAQPVGSYMGVKYERTTTEGPISFSRLETSGALERSMRGLQTLNLIASRGWSSGNVSWHDRPTWQFPLDREFTKTDQEFIQRAQDLLRELGPTLVELKMLAP
ncbi:MAG: hypothetical protein KF708_06970 [Pirellulales bacterium]|nr:hypothetical protein [Pirellulales bacterium]